MNKTHSHDTATPALSVESEYVLVPREPTKAMIAAALNVNLTNEDEIADAYNIYHSMIAAAPAPNSSPPAKGGEAEALTEAMDFIKRYARHDGSCLTGREGDYGERTCECDFNSKRVRLRAKIAALATPSPQPADAVRNEIGRVATDLALLTLDVDDPRISNSIATSVRILRAALASDPAPAGEAVEPVSEAGDGATRDCIFPQEAWQVAGHFYGTHEEAESSSRQHFDIWAEPKSPRRWVPATTLEAERARADELGRERDDAQKALETARAETSAMHRRAQEEEYLRALIIGHCESWLEYYGRTKDRNRLTLMAIMRVARNRKRFIRALEEFAARSASREGASDE